MDPVSMGLIGTAALAGGVGTAASGMMSKAPKPPSPVRIPQPDDPDQIAARKEKMMKEFGQRQGRDSTALAPSAPDATYTRTTLG